MSVAVSPSRVIACSTATTVPEPSAHPVRCAVIAWSTSRTGAQPDHTDIITTANAIPAVLAASKDTALRTANFSTATTACCGSRVVVTDVVCPNGPTGNPAVLLDCGVEVTTVAVFG
ncbi:hypothetical protein GCM10027184_27290 [Saccharothrix stipae]